MKSSKTILVVAAHPDDEVLGCGGTIASYTDKNYKVFIIFMADGVSSHNNELISLVEVDKRKQFAISSCAILGAQKPQFLGLPDNEMDTCSILKITKKLESLIDKIKPNIVYTHHDNDLNIDHKLTYQAVMTACRPQPNSFVSEIYSFEVLSSTGWETSRPKHAFVPNTFINITNHWEKKIEALKCYDNEMKDFPHARSYESVRCLSRYRGASVGVEYAEAFYLERKINKIR